MSYKVRESGNYLEISIIIIRPCAERHGFYKMILWYIVCGLLNVGCNRILASHCLETNRDILQAYTFDIVFNDVWEWYDAEGSADKVKQMLDLQGFPQKYTMPGRSINDVGYLNRGQFPSSDNLNSQEYVTKRFQTFELPPT